MKVKQWRREGGLTGESLTGKEIKQHLFTALWANSCMLLRPAVLTGERSEFWGVRGCINKYIYLKSWGPDGWWRIKPLFIGGVSAGGDCLPLCSCYCHHFIRPFKCRLHPTGCCCCSASVAQVFLLLLLLPVRAADHRWSTFKGPLDCAKNEEHVSQSVSV